MASEGLNNINSIWCIAYINRSYIDLVEQDLGKNLDYHGIIPYIPTVRILRKVFKGKNEFENIPLLFNYGFFKIPKRLAENSEFLLDMRDNISCIFSWVKDLIPKKKIPILDKETKEIVYYKKTIPVAIATEDEITNIAKSQVNLSIYDSEDLENIVKGVVITLHGYPFDNMQAEILKINSKKKEMKVRLIFDNIDGKEITVSFDNVYYTIYQGGYDENFREKSLEEIEERGKVRLDKLMSNIYN